jgi:hypothetical protein
MGTQYKQFPGKVKSWDDKALTIEHFISTETQDDGGDIMLADGMKVRGKPVVLFQHGLDPKFGNEPIAKVLDVRVGLHDGKKGLIAKTQYYDGRHLTPPDSTGVRLYEKARDDIMPNWSIGYDSKKSEPTKNGGRIVSEWELHEYSQVGVGMNSEACVIKFMPTESKEADGLAETPKEFETEGDGKSSNEDDQLKAKTETGKVAHVLAHKAIHCMHKAMTDDLKCFTKDELCEKGTHGCATAALKDFADNSQDHVEKYIKAVREMEKDDTSLDALAPKSDETGAEEKAYTPAHRELHKCRDELVKAIHCFKGDKSVVPSEKAEKLLDKHHEDALPHAKNFIKSWQESHTEPSKTAPDPADTGTDEGKVFKFKIQEPEKPKVVRLKAQPKPLVTPELVVELVKAGLVAYNDNLRQELRKAAGKVT